MTPNDHRPAEEDIGAEADARPVCLCCLGELESDHSLFCPGCGAPVDGLSAMLPFEKIFAEGFVWRRAAESPRDWRVVVGIWLTIGPVVALLIPGLVALWPGIVEPSVAEPGDPLFAVALLLMVVIHLALIGRVTVNFFRNRQRRVSVAPNPA